MHLKYQLFFLIVSELIISGLCDLYVINRHSGTKLRFYRDVTSNFGRSVPDEGIIGFAVRANPLNACSPIAPAPRQPPGMEAVPMIAVIVRYGGCNFEDKVKAAQDANFSAAVIFNLHSESLVPMGGTDRSLIPSVFIGYSNGEEILRLFSYPKSDISELLITPDDPFDLNSYLLPFAIIIGICFVIMLGIVIFKCIQDHRRSRRHRLPKSALKKLPLIKFKNGDPYETCCICLEDFVEGEKLRILPCDHGYHSKCIDPWLVKNKRICPQCRMRVFDESNNDNSSDSETENAPLVTNQLTNQTSGGTFGGVRGRLFSQRIRRMLNQENEERPLLDEEGEDDEPTFNNSGSIETNIESEREEHNQLEGVPESPTVVTVTTSETRRNRRRRRRRERQDNTPLNNDDHQGSSAPVRVEVHASAECLTEAGDNQSSEQQNDHDTENV